MARGLSPRVRGNQDQPLRGPVGYRSIPACTGEPVRSAVKWSCNRVYPRVYGGTEGKTVPEIMRQGLSPRVRGNQAGVGSKSPLHGSIPACTGEPCYPQTRPWCRQVYPRVYGGTAVWACKYTGIHGLSPRVRGNLLSAGGNWLNVGSIPACTGEPKACSCRPVGGWVYPRVYGGTDVLEVCRIRLAGLSPRVRGNPRRNSARDWLLWSIPACTGEPHLLISTRCLYAVYPRVYGGTRVIFASAL